MGSEVLRADKMVCLRIILVLSLISLSLAAHRRGGPRCETFRCRSNTITATHCCNSGINSRCCAYIGGGGGGSGWNSGGNNNNKPGTCPPYHGRRSSWQHGGSGYNPGSHQHHGRCIRDSECPGELKCCYL